MGFYLRKSIKLGPVRLNLSKAGLGYSIGVKGCRYGVRPDGRAYVHAGGGGFYYRKNLERQQAPAANIAAGSTTVYETARAERLAEMEGENLATFLNRSYGLSRTVFPTTVVAACVIFGAFAVHSILGAITTPIAVFTFVWVARWESKRRSVFVEYEFNESGLQAYQKVLEGFNKLASCERVWILDTSRRITTLQDFKTNAGASEIVRRTSVRLGAGLPPFVQANLSIPTIVARDQTLYFLPDCVLVHDSTGIGGVPYSNLQVFSGTVSFIEESLPRDAQVIGRTWLHPNKDGGPDRRFSTNYELPICLYGTAAIASSNGLSFLFHTSQTDAAGQFQAGIQLAVGCQGIHPSVEVNPEHFESFATCLRSSFANIGTGAVSLVKLVDAFLAAISGEGNTIVHGFLRVLGIGFLIVAVGVIAFTVVR